MERRFIQPPGLHRPPSYSHVATVRDARVVFLSGQIALDANGSLVGAGDLAAQTEQVWKNIVTALAAVGATTEDILKITTYVVGYRPEHRDLVNGIRRRYISAAEPPASTLVGVASLALPEFLVEIEVVAATA